MIYGSVCSGIEAASVAWHPLGWKAAWLAEIEPFPSAVLAHRYPDVPNLGDMTKIAKRVLLGEIQAPDLLVGGTPCQAFSVAGMREGLSDPRGALTIKFVELADAIDHVRIRRSQEPSIVVWENVPGVLSDKGNAFGCFLGALAGEDCELQPPGGKWKDAGCVYGPARAIAWRVLDAQYFGVAQRRRRVFVVASARNGFDPAAVLFEFEGVRRDTAPSRGEGQNAARATAPGVDLRNGAITGDVAHTVQAGHHAPDPGGTPHVLTVHGTQDPDIRLDQAHTLGRNSGQENAVLAFSCKDYGADAGELAPTLRAMGHGDSHANAGGQVAVAFCREIAQTITSNYGKQVDNSNTGLGPNVVCVTGDITHTLKAEGFDASEDGTGRGQPIVPATFMADDYKDGTFERCDTARPLTTSADRSRAAPIVAAQSAVRRLTPVECERLQGFPDGHTDVLHRGKPAADGPRYKAIGNSKAVPVVRWIGRRIAAVTGSIPGAAAVE